MKIIKFAGGGLPAYSSFQVLQKPILPYLPTALATQSESSSSTSKSDKSIGLLSEKMQEQLMKHGLPSDVKAFMQSVDVFGLGLDANDPISQYSAYQQILGALPEIRLNKEEYDKALEKARNDGTLNEYAISSDGRLYVQTSDNNIVLRDPFKIKNGDTPLTISEFARYRAYSEQYAFDNGQITHIIANGVSRKELNDYVTGLLSKIGSATTKNEFYVKNGSEDKLSKGYQALIQQGEDGTYKITTENVNLNESAEYLLNYVLMTMPKNYHGLLKCIAAEYGLDNKSGERQILLLLIRGRIDTTSKLSIDYDKLASEGLLGGNGEKGSSKKVYEMNLIMQIVTGDGGQHTTVPITFGTGTAYQVDAQVITWIPDDTGNGTVGPGNATKALLTSKLGRILNTDSIHIGDQRIDSSQLSKLYYDGSKAYALALPFTYDNNGLIMPNWTLMDAYEKACKDINKEGGMQNVSRELVNSIFKRYGLDNYFNPDGTLNRKSFMRFVGISLIGDESVFKDPDELSQLFTKIEDESLEDTVSKALGSEKKPMKLDGDLYRAVAYIPIYDSFSNARSASGQDPWVKDPGYEQMIADELMVEKQKDLPQIKTTMSKSQI